MAVKRVLTRRALGPLVAVLLLLPAASAVADVHVMKITAVFAGVASAPDARYVELQMHSAGQRFTDGASVQVFDAANSSLGTFTFTADVANGANQSRILVATAEAEIFFDVTADLVMSSAVIPASGGKVCFQAPGHGVIDCVAWGDYAGPAGGVGTPFRAAEGIPAGAAMERSLKGNAMLEANDDTNDSATDFRFALPAPRNNAGATGAAPGGALSFAGDLVVPELEQTHQVLVQRGGATSGAVGVDYETLDGSATAGLDYTSASGDLEWSDGEGADASFGMDILDDDEPEGPETILLRVRDPTGGAVLGPMPNATITIEANDDADAPTSRITKPKHRKKLPAKKARKLTGRATDADAGVEGVEIALLQRLKKGCTWWNGKKFTKRACSSPRWLAAKGAASWSYRVSKLLPSSTGKIKHYELRSRARDLAGNVESSFRAGRNKNRFEVR